MNASTRSRGLVLALLSAATFGTSGTFATSLLDAGWSPAAAVTMRIGLGALFLTPLAVVQLVRLPGRRSVLRSGAGTIVAFGLVACAGCQLFYFNAVQHLSVGVALLLEYLASILVVAWLWVRHGHRPRRLTLAGMGLAVAGLALVLDLTGSVTVDRVGVVWGLLAALGLATYFFLSTRSEAAAPPVVLAWGGLLVGTVAFVLLGAVGILPMHATTGRVHFLGHAVSWVVPMLGLSLVAAAFAYVAGIAGARLLGPKVAAFVGLTEVLFAVLFAWVLLNQLPHPVQLVGGLLIVGGVVLVRLDEHEPDPIEPLPSSPLATGSSEADNHLGAEPVDGLAAR